MHIHLVGVAGTGMGSLAGLLAELGHRVTGSDPHFDPPMGPLLQSWGVQCLPGFSAENVSAKPDLVVIGNVCRADNVEAQAARAQNLPVTHIAGALQRFALKGQNVTVCAGTHGKTTTSSMLAWMLDQAGLRPGFFIGGIPNNFGRGFRAAASTSDGQALQTSAHDAAPSRSGLSAPFVIEGDEYDTAFFEKTAKFLHYTPHHAIITSLEHDHIDIYPTEASYIQAFEQFVRLIPATGVLVAHANDAHVARLVDQARCAVAMYAVEHSGEGSTVSPKTQAASIQRELWEARDLSLTAEGIQKFCVYHGNQPITELELRQSGKHNVANALAAFVLARTAYGCGNELLRRALFTYSGTRCRQELLGEPSGIRLYRDFAHHPTAVAATLEGLRIQHPQGRLFAVFEPRSATACRNRHQAEYCQAFAAADSVLLAPLGRSGLGPEERLDTDAVAQSLKKQGLPAKAYSSLDTLVADLLATAEPGDTVALLSNGAFGGIHAQLLARFGERTVTQHFNRGAL